jgi:hypothetical protein
VREPVGDRFFLTAEERLSSIDYCFFGDVLLLGGKSFRVRVDLPEMKANIETAGADLVPVELPMDVERLSLYAEDGSRGVMMFKGEKQAQLPPGRYRLAAYKGLRKDAEGDLWSVAARGTGLGPAFVVAPGTRNVLEFGEPFVARAEVPDAARETIRADGAGSVPLAFRIEGAAYEVVEEVRRVSGDKTTIPLSSTRNYMPLEPTYRIEKATGETVAEGSFKYG